jgi:single stranded DNA-binding protein
MNLNKVELLGGQTRDPELRTGRTGGSDLERALALNGSRYDPEIRGQKVTSEFVSVIAFGFVAEYIAGLQLGRGDEVYVLGELGHREIQKPDGTKENKTRVIAAVISPTRVRPRNQQAGGHEAPREDQSGSEIWQ